MSLPQPYAARSIPVALLSGLMAVRAWGATATGGGNGWWDVFIVLTVLGFTVASAALPLAACKQWQRPWRGAAAFPLLVLLLWVLWIGSARLLNPGTHPLWLLEIFAWAMFNMIYMVAAITCKRILEKADQIK